MKKIILFTDGSADPRANIGYGAYLSLIDGEIALKVRCFEHTSSTKLELQTVLWALKDIQVDFNEVTLYTDSQNILSLHKRRERICANDTLKNYALYQAFFQLTDQVTIKIVKVSGHLKKSQKNDVDHYFSMVDKASRKALRAHHKHEGSA